MKFEHMILSVMNKAKYLNCESIRDKIMIEHDRYYQVDTVSRKIRRIAHLLDRKEFANKCCKGTHARWRIQRSKQCH